MRALNRKRPCALIRVDVSQRIGLGHLIRTLALAEALQERDIEPFFLLGDAEPEHVKLVEERGFPAYRLRCASGSLLDVAFTRSFAHRCNAVMVVLDSYRFERGYYQAMGGDGLFLVSLDDTGRSLPVDLVINPNAGAEQLSYPMAGMALQGLRYSLLRREFSRPLTDVTPRGLLISFGGTDPTHATERILRLLPEPPQQVTVLYGGSDQGALARSIEIAEAAGHQVTLKVGYHEMYPLMRSAERAISAGGGTLLELACLGVPTLGFAVAENQLPGVSALHAAGVMTYGGALDSCDDASVRETLARFLHSPREVHRVVDGQGARRVVDVIISALSTKRQTQPTLFLY